MCKGKTNTFSLFFFAPFPNSILQTGWWNSIWYYHKKAVAPRTCDQSFLQFEAAIPCYAMWQGMLCHVLLPSSPVAPRIIGFSCESFLFGETANSAAICYVIWQGMLRHVKETCSCVAKQFRLSTHYWLNRCKWPKLFSVVAIQDTSSLLPAFFTFTCFYPARPAIWFFFFCKWNYCARFVGSSKLPVFNHSINMIYKSTFSELMKTRCTWFRDDCDTAGMGLGLTFGGWHLWPIYIAGASRRGPLQLTYILV